MNLVEPAAPAPRWTAASPALGLAVAALVLVAAVLRLHQLDGQLWHDEISALRGYRRPFLETLTTFPVFFPNPLYELSAHAALRLLGESAFAIRLPAALFGLAGSLAFLRLAWRWLGAGDALLAAALLAVSYHHVYYSQDARGYTAYLCFALLATHGLRTLLERMGWRSALGYAGASALATYAHPFGVFVLAGQLPVALVVARWRRRGGSRAGATPAQLCAVGALAALATLALYAPLVPASLAYVGNEARAASHGPRVLGLLPELLEGLRAGFAGWPGLLLGGCVGAVGALGCLRRTPILVALLAAPLLVSAAATTLLGAGIHPRYFLLALPLAYLVAAHGLLRSVRWLARDRLGLPATAAARLQLAAGVLAVAVSALPLRGYYALPKQDYLGALREVEARALPGDRVVAADLAGRSIRAWYDPDLPVVDDVEALLRLEAASRRVWVLSSLERAMAGRAPELLARLHREYRLVAVRPGLVGDGALRIYLRDAESY